MLLTAAREHHLDQANSWMIGDSGIDAAAGRNAGCKTARLMRIAESYSESANVIARSLPTRSARYCGGKAACGSDGEICFKSSKYLEG
jgi:histidinol phosphatase-like enzyme